VEVGVGGGDVVGHGKVSFSMLLHYCKRRFREKVYRPCPLLPERAAALSGTSPAQSSPPE
jgi:hypothetical protein